MGLIEKFKNRETKKKLREENGKLLAQVEFLQRFRPPVCTVERNIQLVQANKEVSLERAYLPEEYIKEDLVRCLVDELKPFIEYDFMDGINGGKIYTAKLYVATGDRNGFQRSH